MLKLLSEERFSWHHGRTRCCPTSTTSARHKCGQFDRDTRAENHVKTSLEWKVATTNVGDNADTYFA